MKKLIDATRQVPCIQCGELMGWDDSEPGCCNECEEENKSKRIAALESELAALKASAGGPFDIAVGGVKAREIPETVDGGYCSNRCPLAFCGHTKLGCAFGWMFDDKPGVCCPRYKDGNGHWTPEELDAIRAEAAVISASLKEEGKG